MVAVLLVWALAQAPDYDAFCDRDGNVVTREHGLGLMAMLQRSGQVEAIFADAAKGNARARRVVETLEKDYFPDIGREVAEQVSRPPCLVPAVRELSGWCVPDWSFLDFLSREQPGGARLRRALFDGYAERLRQRGLENQLVVSAMNAILGVAVAAAVLREAEAASGKLTSTNPTKSIASLRANIVEHRQKLEAYKRNPEAFDNEGLLKNAPSVEIRQRIIEARIRHLEQEIRTFEKNIRDLGGEP